jgi:bifunctional ADP-heptose synthase (sugar kinase/adenylyltransferase)
MTQFLRQHAPEYDLILVCDFGNGLITPPLVEALGKAPRFLALNTQTNSGNRGFNVVTKYQRANYISLNEPELRLAVHDRTSSLEGIVADIAEVMECPTFSITRGVKGVLCFHTSLPPMTIPALSTHSVDRIGAGDNYFSLSALCLANQTSPLLAGFIGSAAAALSVQTVGNRDPIRKAALLKFITRLMK